MNFSESLLGIFFLLTIFAMGLVPAIIFNNPLFLFIWILIFFLKISDENKNKEVKK